MNKRIWVILWVAAFVAGCGSNVKLDDTSDVPVVDRAGTSVNPLAPAGPAAGSEVAGTSQSRVAPVALDSTASQAAGPAGVERLVYFDYDSFVIKPDFKSLIDSHARFLRANPTRKIAIEGHTDERGGREYNLALGQKRAEAVRRALAVLGVADGQVEAVSLGKEKPAAAGADESIWARNRRAEIVYR